MINLIILLLPFNALHSSFCQVSIVELSMVHPIGEESAMSRNVTTSIGLWSPGSHRRFRTASCLPRTSLGLAFGRALFAWAGAQPVSQTPTPISDEPVIAQS
jgi:hypothetical protein